MRPACPGLTLANVELMRFLLVPSPLVGPASWEPVADELRELEQDVRVVDTGAPSTPGDVLDSVVDAASGLTDLVLVPHSNAGLYAPHLGALLELQATVYVDAALAGLDAETALAPAGLHEMLRRLADADGLLPPWTQWWDDLDGLFPDESSRTAVELGQPRLPLSYFDARLPVPPGWVEHPSAYLAFGDTYADEVTFARGRGWPLTVMAGGHLHALHDPAGVATEVLRLARLVVGGRS
jgi:hypothetical protein